jgi:hypothetical protein
MGTHLKLERNIMRTHWEPGKNEKKIPFHPPTKNPKENIKPYPKLLIGCMKILFPIQLSIFILEIGQNERIHCKGKRNTLIIHQSEDHHNVFRPQT